MNSYVAVSAKTRAMYGECLDEKDFQNLWAKQSVAEIFSYLKNNGSYRKLFERLNEKDVHRSDIECFLWKEIFDEYKRLLNFVGAKNGSVLEFWFLRREVDFLKERIRNIYNHESRANAFENEDATDSFFKAHTNIDVGLCKRAKDLGDFVKACADTVYYDVLKRAQSVGADYFSIAMTLDGLYYRLLWDAAKKHLSKEEQELFKKLLGSRIDMLNIIWIYRGKRYFNFDNKLIYTYLLPIKYKITNDLLKRLTEAENAEEIPVILKNTPYKDLFDNLEDGYFIEENYRREVYKISKKIFRNSPESVAAIFAYLGLKELEILNLTRIIECVRYNINPEMIKKHIRIG